MAENNKHKLRLIRWAKDGYPPIDLSKEYEAIINLVHDYSRLENERDRLLNAATDIKKTFEKAIDVNKDVSMTSGIAYSITNMIELIKPLE